MPPSLDYVESGPTQGHRHTCVWLHGLGADGNDLKPFADALNLPARHTIRQVFPHAPLRHIALWGDVPLRAWYRFASLDFGRGEHAGDIRSATALVETLLIRERNALPASGRLVVGGFSQGGLIALAAGLAGNVPVDGVAALSTYQWSASMPAQPSPPVFMAHGDADSVIPIAIGRASAQRLASQGVAVDWREYAMAHAICQPEIGDLAGWLGARLKD
ncbi:alpha/beta hydrolase [Acidihalobacter prosperus]|uniref:Phospholipase/carboxylesterase/thioesterase domain-containing protein n=1 Tax=Acidihalobacter prosperus TaxID=160660 RepID=A0A1A6C1F9_9GAMM|nr:hypothetical protein [Acidihalobacter prosperus]OBS08397.1 hypothetical protein Thpro_022647 [Acidihalobacter prosperus]